MRSDSRSTPFRGLLPAAIVLFVGLLAGCGYVVETSLLQEPVVFDWGFRQEITLTNAGSSRTDYSVRLSLDPSNVEFWQHIESDGRSIHLTESNGYTSLPFFLDYFDYGSQRAVLHVRLSSLPAGDTTIYLYFDDPDATLDSSASDVFVFYDDFEDGDVSDWTNIPPGEVLYYADASNGVLLKTSDSDPTGGYATVPSVLSGFEVVFRTNRINENGGAANRYALENDSEDGYGPQISNFGGGETFVIEERSGGSGSALVTDPSPPSLSQNTWYTVVFRRSGTDMELLLYDDSWTIIDSITATDPTVTSFTRFVVRGGYEFLTDDVRIREYTSPDPTTGFGSVEEL